MLNELEGELLQRKGKEFPLSLRMWQQTKPRVQEAFIYLRPKSAGISPHKGVFHL